MSIEVVSKICYTIAELHDMRVLPLGLNKLYELASKPGFPAKRIGRKIVISKAGLEKWMEDSSVKYV